MLFQLAQEFSTGYEDSYKSEYLNELTNGRNIVDEIVDKSFQVNFFDKNKVTNICSGCILNTLYCQKLPRTFNFTHYLDYLEKYLTNYFGTPGI